MTPEQQEDDNCRRAIELQISDKDDTFSVNFDALIDSGSLICIVKERYIPRKHVVVNSELERFHGINGSGLRIIGCVQATLIFERGKYDVVIRVVPNDTMRTSLLLGRDFMKMAKLSINSNKEATDKEITDIMNIEVDKDVGTIVQSMQINDDLSFEVQRRARDVLETNYVNAQRSLKPAVENIMTLTLTSNEPFYCKPRRLSHYEKGKLREILDRLVTDGIIRESTSEYASPIVLTRKKKRGNKDVRRF